MSGEPANPPAGPLRVAPRVRARLRLLYALFALSGFCGLIYESIWSHYLKLFVGHDG